MKRAIACVLLVLFACTKHEEQGTTQSLPSVTATTAAAAASTGAISDCSVMFECSLSHPGLGSGSRATSVDLGKCERASWSESGPYDPTSPRNPPKKTITAVAKSECDRLRDLAASLGPADARAASESAQIDTEACSLSITCAGDAGATERFRVQRQTTTGGTRVEQTIRAVQGAR